MAKNKLDKKTLSLEAKFEDILVCNNKNLRPFVEIFIFEPENATQKNLGSLLGVLEISDTSEDSSYIVNYLSSIIKKEYFSKPKRPSIESFEAALHKANLALSKLAEHGNINWLGKLNAIIAIIEKNNLHISQAGSTSAFLLRAKGLTDISEGLSASEPEPNPLKTFVNVSSGRLEIEDKLIIATESIFDIFSLEEIKKSALRFSGEKFIQFLKTALVNELEKAAVLVVDIQEKSIEAPAPAPKPSEDFNAFSQAAFSRGSSRNAPAANENKRKTSVTTDAAESLQEHISKEIASEINTGKKEFTDEKSGHIYIKESMGENMNIKVPNEYLISLEEKTSAMKKGLKKFSIASGTFVINTAKKISLPKFNFKIKKSTPAEHEESASAAEPEPIKPKIIATEINRSEIIEPKISAPSAMEAEPEAVRSKLIEIEWDSVQKKAPATDDQRSPITPFFEKFKSKVNKESIDAPVQTSQIDASADREKVDILAKLKAAGIKIKNIISSLSPDFSRLKNIINKLNYQQKIYAILVILAIFIVPLAYIKISQRFVKPPAPTPEPVMEVVLPFAQDKNVTRLESLNSAYSGNDVASVQNLAGKFFAVSQTQIVALENQESFPIPSDFGQIKFIAAMDDLNMIFIISQANKILSFSPVSKKFQENTIEIPAGSTISAAGTYLTYLYLIDVGNSQIYRFPRATGGFGAKADWLKDTVDLSQTSGMALSDNIFIVDGKTIIKLFKGKKQDFNLEVSATPIVPFKVYTKPDSQSIFVLDKQNSRIIKLDLTGQIISQYYNTDISNANDFTVDETNNTVYISTPSNIESFSIN